MFICDEHLYQLERSKISLAKLEEMVLLYQQGGRCFCCNSANHKKCCSYTNDCNNTYNNNAYMLLNCAASKQLMPSEYKKWG